MFSFKFNLFSLIFWIILCKLINSFVILPFETLFIKDDSIKIIDYYNTLFQNELYTNLSVSTPIQNIKTLLKMDSSGFILYEGAFNHNSSVTIEKGKWDTNVGWLWRQTSFPAKDYFYLYKLNSHKELEQFILDKNNNNLVKTNKTSFIVVNKTQESSYNNKNFFYYGLIGLKLVENSNFNMPEFVISLRKERDIKSYTFSLKFNKDNYTYKNFFNNNHKGYFIVGEELIDDENEKSKIKFIDAEKQGKYIGWLIYFDKIYTNDNINEKNNKSIINNFYAKITDVELCVNLPYLIGTLEYFEYINNTFFSELIEKELCYFYVKNNKRGLYSFICNGESEYLVNYIKNNFPDLIFEKKELEENFTLTKYDLFSYNNFNKSDNNLYFLVMFPPLNGFSNYYNWALGIPFFKKYRLSFNYDTKKIGYYKYNDINNNDNNNSDNNNDNNSSDNFFESIIFKIICIIILIIIIFILGMIFQKKCFNANKKKATELGDNDIYNSYNNIDDGINNDNIN